MDSKLFVWMNGKIISAVDARLSVYDEGFTRGYAAYDVCRTFGGKVFQVDEHVDRFIQSCRALEISLAYSKANLFQACAELEEKHKSLVSKYGDFMLGFHATHGCSGDGIDLEASVILKMTPMPFAKRKNLFSEGAHLQVPSIRRTPPWAQSPRVKTHNYLNLILAEKEIHRISPSALGLLLDENGCLSEGVGFNVFLVKNGILYTPDERLVLPGISRKNTMMLAQKRGIQVVEKSLELIDAYGADEMFITSTSLCLCAVKSINGNVFSTVPGPVTKTLIEDYAAWVEFDFANQYRVQVSQ